MRISDVIAVAGALVAASAATPAAADGQSYFWRWTDGSDAKVRTLGEGRYRTQQRLPRLVVFAHPSTPRRLVTLEYGDRTGWHPEDTARTDRDGRAVLELNPYCADGSWCTDTVGYRLLVNGIDTTFAITYVA